MNLINEFLNLPWPRFAILFLFFYLLLVLYAWFYGDKILFPYPSPPSYTKDDVSLYLHTHSGYRIACISEEAINSNGINIIYSHGNGEDIGMIQSLMGEIKGYGCNVISYDYPGYGLSEGKASEQNCYEAIDSVFEYLTKDKKISPNRILLWGRSLGTGPSCYLASKENVGGLILETPFLSAFRTISEIPVLPWDRFRNIEFVDSVKCPSLVIHGRWDEVVPFRQGKKIYNNLPQPKTFLEIKEASHNDLVIKGGELYKKSIEKFLNELL